jgi:hypothetical protein
MIRPPFAARVAAGLAVTFVEETRRLPTTAATLPMTAVSQLLQTSMRVQQKMTQLAIKGDQALAWLYPPEDQPEWVVFDEDRVEQTSRAGQTAIAASAAEARTRQGRFALYSTPVPPASAAGVADPASEPTAPAAAQAASADEAVGEMAAGPEVVRRLNYGSLTLAQLRARLKQLTPEDLAALLAYEESGQARAPYLALLSNRIAATAK